MIVEECDICNLDCLIAMCGLGVVQCWYVGPYAIPCIIAYCGVGALVCCIMG